MRAVILCALATCALAVFDSIESFRSGSGSIGSGQIYSHLNTYRKSSFKNSHHGGNAISGFLETSSSSRNSYEFGHGLGGFGKSNSRSSGIRGSLFNLLEDSDVKDSFGRSSGSFGRSSSSFGRSSGSFERSSGSFGRSSGSFGKDNLRISSGVFGLSSGISGKYSSGSSSGSFGRSSGSFGTGSGSFGRSSGSFGRSSGSFGTGSGRFGDGSDSSYEDSTTYRHSEEGHTTKRERICDRNGSNCVIKTTETRTRND